MATATSTPSDSPGPELAEGPAQPVTARRSGTVFAFVGFLGIVTIAAAAFGWSARKGASEEGYLSYVTVADTPVVVVADPPSDASPPYTMSTVIGDAIPLALSLPGVDVGGLVLQALSTAGVDPESTRLIRTTSTGSRADGSAMAYISVGMLLDSGYHEFLGLSPDGSILWNDPGIVQLPADLSRGRSWTGAGMTNGFATYSFTGTVLDGLQITQPPGPVATLAGCLDTQTRLEQQVPEGESFTLASITTWCPGWGTVASRNTEDGTFTRVGLPQEVSWPRTTSAPPVVPSAGTPLASPVSVMVISRPPIESSAGLIVVNDVQGDMLAVTTTSASVEAAQSAIAWMQHPGGQVLGITEDADRIYVTSSSRALEAFDAQARLQWLADLPDAAVGAPAVLGDIVAVALVDGTLRAFAAASGEPLWTVHLSDVITESPIADAASRSFIAADSAGYVVSVDPSGSERWTASVDGVNSPLSALPDGSVVIGQDSGALTLIDPDGSTRWSVTLLDGSVFSPAAQWGDIVAVPTDGGLRGLDAATGETRWDAPDIVKGYLGPRGVVADRTRVIRVSGDGQQEVLAQAQEITGQEPQSLYLAKLGGSWAFITQQGAITFLEGEFAEETS